MNDHRRVANENLGVHGRGATPESLQDLGIATDPESLKRQIDGARQAAKLMIAPDFTYIPNEHRPINDNMLTADEIATGKKHLPKAFEALNPPQNN